MIENYTPIGAPPAWPWSATPPGTFNRALPPGAHLVGKEALQQPAIARCTKGVAQVTDGVDVQMFGHFGGNELLQGGQRSGAVLVRLGMGMGRRGAGTEAPAQELTGLVWSCRFDQEIVHPGFHHPFAVLQEGIGGQGHHRNRIRGCSQLTQQTGGCQPVQARHVHIHEHQIRRLLLHSIERFLPILSQTHAVAHALEEQAHVPAVDRVIVHHQQGQATGIFAGGITLGPGRRKRGVHRLTKLHRQHQAENAAFAGSAVYPDVTAHQTGQGPGDLQPQSAAAKAARGAGIALREALEQPGLGGGVHADAGVTDIDSQAQKSAGLDMRTVGGGGSGGTGGTGGTC